ncbi:DedA family protein [Janibacter cremeus]|uniref:Membrane protein DedA with SNARE-associated domain n=1 Tax=Janibacter cremeus TaxID=1285192 RepID=A0A852VTP7_9MICO|nr:DedA family protein [Janibacter cremeus]NYF98033.1 membrane protein DedA with SNARE-associated domain [Janibacter cremeus]
MNTIVEWVLDLMERIGGPGIALGILMENVFPPIPSEVILPLAGFTASQGRYSPAEAVLWATLGSVLGAIVLYGIGAALGLDRLRLIAKKMPLVDVADVDKADTWFTKHGPKAVFFGRFIPGVRSLISIPAGIDRMPMTTFIGFTTAGSLLWNSLFVWIGYQLGGRYHLVEEYMDPISKVVYVLIIIAVLATVAWMARRSMRRQRDPDDVVDLDTD